VSLVRIAIAAAVALVVVSSAACGSDVGDATEGPVLRVAVLQYGDVTDPVELVSSSALAVDLAIEQAEARGDLASASGLSFVETAGEDPEAVEEAARALAADPTVVAAVVTPFVEAPAAERAFVDAGVPVFSFSGHGGVPGVSGWRRLVPTADSEATALQELAGGSPCVAGASRVAPSTDGADLGSDPSVVGRRAVEEACTGVTWLGDADGAIEAAASLAEVDRGTALLVTATARADRFASEGFPDVVGTVAVVPCRSVEVSDDDDARRFVHAYQAGHGVPPGLCAAEGYGLGRWLVDEGSRAALDDALRLGPTVPSPAGAIDLAAGAAAVPVIERVVGVRWLPEAG